MLQKVIFHKMTKLDMPHHHLPWDLCHPKCSLMLPCFAAIGDVFYDSVWPSMAVRFTEMKAQGVGNC
jgi:hypothetical protein